MSKFSNIVVSACTQPLTMTMCVSGANAGNIIYHLHRTSHDDVEYNTNRKLLLLEK